MPKLASLKPQIVELQLPAPYDAEPYPIYSMTWSEWETVGADVPDVDTASVPKLRIVENGKVVLKDDRKSLMQAQSQIETRRLLRRLAYALQMTHQYDELKGVTLDEAETLVNDLGAAAVRALSGWLIEQIRMAQARVNSRAARFRDGRDTAPDDEGEAEARADIDAI